MCYIYCFNVEFHPEDGGSVFLQKVVSYLPDCDTRKPNIST